MQCFICYSTYVTLEFMHCFICYSTYLTLEFMLCFICYSTDVTLEFMHCCFICYSTYVTLEFMHCKRLRSKQQTELNLLHPVEYTAEAQDMSVQPLLLQYTLYPQCPLVAGHSLKDKSTLIMKLTCIKTLQYYVTSRTQIGIEITRLLTPKYTSTRYRNMHKELFEQHYEKQSFTMYPSSHEKSALSLCTLVAKQTMVHGFHLTRFTLNKQLLFR